MGLSFHVRGFVPLTADPFRHVQTRVVEVVSLNRGLPLWMGVEEIFWVWRYFGSVLSRLRLYSPDRRPVQTSSDPSCIGREFESLVNIVRRRGGDILGLAFHIIGHVPVIVTSIRPES